jgi:hypothetical protein
MVGMPVPLPFTEADIKLAAGARSFERNLMKILDQNGR